MQMLKEQETIIDSIDNKLNIVDSNNKKSEVIVKSMGSTWNFIKNIFVSSNDEEELQKIKVK